MVSSWATRSGDILLAPGHGALATLSVLAVCLLLTATCWWLITHYFGGMREGIEAEGRRMRSPRVPTPRRPTGSSRGDAYVLERARHAGALPDEEDTDTQMEARLLRLMASPGSEYLCSRHHDGLYSGGSSVDRARCMRRDCESPASSVASPWVLNPSGLKTTSLSGLDEVLGGIADEFDIQRYGASWELRKPRDMRVHTSRSLSGEDSDAAYVDSAHRTKQPCSSGDGQRQISADDTSRDRLRNELMRPSASMPSRQRIVPPGPLLRRATDSQGGTQQQRACSPLRRTGAAAAAEHSRSVAPQRVRPSAATLSTANAPPHAAFQCRPLLYRSPLRMPTSNGKGTEKACCAADNRQSAAQVNWSSVERGLSSVKADFSSLLPTSDLVSVPASCEPACSSAPARQPQTLAFTPARSAAPRQPDPGSGAQRSGAYRSNGNSGAGGAIRKSAMGTPATETRRPASGECETSQAESGSARQKFASMVSMAEWHKVIKLQAGAPVLFNGLRGVVKRANPIRETYAVHFPSEQRTLDVPYGSEGLWADVSSGEPTYCTAAAQAQERATSATESTPKVSPKITAECFSSARLMEMM